MTALLVWGLFPRLLGLVYLIAFASLWGQVVPLAGGGGVSPIKPQLAKIRSDYPLWRCWCYFPTLLWLRADEWGLRALVMLGIGGAAWAMVGGPGAGGGLLICWLCYLSLHPAVGLAYPWECLLLEAGFLALFLPDTNALPDLSATEPPLPAVGWAFRWLLFRMVLGFGKFKFQGINRKELGYLKAFFIAVPLPSRLGWYAHHLPGWFMKLSLAGLFLIEVVAPFLIFIPGDPRLVAAAAIAMLMIAIQLTGNYGHFNLLTLALCVPLLDVHASLLDQPAGGVLWPGSHLLTHAVVLIVFVGGLLYLPSNSWCSLAWPYWPSQRKRPAAWRGLLAFYRFLAPFRILHAYGVFPSISFPAARAVPVIEGTRDGQVWREYPYRWLMAGPSSPPVWVAPHTPRLDHFLCYDVSGTDVSNFLGSTFSLGNPYLFSHTSGLERVVQRLLEGSPSVLTLFRDNPFPDGPPTAIRVSLYMLRPTGLAERRRTGEWWRRDYLGPHLRPATRDSTMWDRWLPDPELFHPDELIWKLRAPRLRRLFDRARGGDGPADVVADSSVGITADDLCRFWDHFIAAASKEERRNWEGLSSVVERMRQSFSSDELRVFERILGRLSLALFSRLEPFYLGQRQPGLGLETIFEVNLLIHHIIAQGHAAYDALYRDPAEGADFVPQMTNESGLFLTAVFWHEKLAYHARKFRLLLRYYTPRYRPGLSGFVKLIPFLAARFEQPAEEHYPNFVRRITDGQWLLVEEAPTEVASMELRRVR